MAEPTPAHGHHPIGPQELIMTAELPPDVRDRAAQAAENAFVKEQRQSGSPDWAVVVDAVAEVLAAGPALRAGDHVQIHDVDSRRPAVVKSLGNLSGPLVVVPVEREHDALKARVDLLEARVRNLQVENVELSCQLDSAEEAIAAALAKGEKP
jgi:hypothetical protein